MDPEDLREDLREKLTLGRELLEKLSNNELRKVQGLAKLEKKIRQELKFLERFEDPANCSELKKEHINCSNLIHLGCLVDSLYSVNLPSAVMQPFNLVKDNKTTKKVNVDIVCDKGSTWIKVVARNAKALNQNYQGGSQFGQRNIIDQVKELIHCSEENCLLFCPPKVKIVFSAGVTPRLKSRISKLGADVEGEVVNVSDHEEDDSEEEDSSEDDEDTCDSSDEVDEEANNIGMDSSRVNLDITAMIAYVSAMTNGRNWFLFKEKILSEQAQWERQRPVKPVLDSIFQDKQLVCCESAMKDFKTILGTLGGQGERDRGEQLISRILVVPDLTSPKTDKLKSSGKIKNRSLTIFSTGDRLRVVTVTANTGFIRAAAGQGVTFATVTHESRALTEDKEKTATTIDTVRDNVVSNQ